MLIKVLEVVKTVNQSAGSMKRKLGISSGTGRSDLMTGFFNFGQPESMHFGSGRFSLPRSIGVRDRSTGLPQV